MGEFMYLRIFRTALAGVLSAAIAIAPAVACTGIMLRNKDGSFVHGRTLEFGAIVDVSIAAVPRDQAFVGTTPSGGGLKYTARHAAVGAMAFKDVNLLDGLNDAGLAVGTFFFPTFAEYALPTADNLAKGLSPADFSNWLLTQFASVGEVRQAIEANAVAIVPTVLAGWGPTPPPFHYIVYDKTGASIVIEPMGGKLVVSDNPLGVLTNSPDFGWHLTNLRNYIALNPRNVPPVQIDGKVFAPLGQGTGGFGLPGDFTPPSRFVRAAFFSATAIPSDNAELGIGQVFHVLNNFDIPIGVAREVDGGVVHSDYTQITVARDPQGLRYYYKTYDDQTVRMVDLGKLDPDAKAVRILSTKGQQPVADMTSQVK